MGIGKKLRRQFLAGILVIVPIGVTIWLLVWIVTSIDNILLDNLCHDKHSRLHRAVSGLGQLQADLKAQ